MTGNTSNSPQTGNASAGGTALVQIVQPNPTPRQIPAKRIRLGTVRDVQRELQRIYIEARGGRLPTQTATRLAYLLNLMAQMIVQSDLEARVGALEQRETRR